MMGCGGCGGRNRSAPVPAGAGNNLQIRANGRQLPVGGIQTRQNFNTASFGDLSSEDIENMANKEFILVQYNHRNRGMHAVVGSATGRPYGYHRSGDTFMVHVDDSKLQPDLFRVVVPDQPTPLGIKVNKQPTPAPPPPPVVKIPPVTPAILVEEVEEEIVVEEIVVEEIVVKEEVKEDILAAAKTSQMIELGAIPGVTPAVEKTLKANGVVTYEKVIELGVDGLIELKYIGQGRAEIIYEYVTENYGPTIQVDD